MIHDNQCLNVCIIWPTPFCTQIQAHWQLLERTLDRLTETLEWNPWLFTGIMNLRALVPIFNRNLGCCAVSMRAVEL